MGRSERLAVVVAMLLSSAGCIPCAYVLPKVHHFPAVGTDAPAGDVTAVLARSSCLWQDPVFSTEAENEIVPLQISEKGRLGSETDITIESAALLISPITYGIERSHKREIRLYRPGYQLVTLRPWPHQAGTVQWICATTLEGRQAALDGLLADLQESHPFPPDPSDFDENPDQLKMARFESALRKKLAANLDDQATRDLLQFVADQYAVLADQYERSESTVTSEFFAPEGPLGSSIPPAPFDPHATARDLRLKSEACRRAARPAEPSG